MLARVQSYLLSGIDALPCEVEVDFDDSVESLGPHQRPIVVGLPDAAVKESVERVKSAMLNCGYVFPVGRVLINLAPADVKKEGPVYDLAIAVGLLHVQGILRTDTRPERRPGLPSRLRAGATSGSIRSGGGGGGSAGVGVSPAQRMFGGSVPPARSIADEVTDAGDQQEPEEPMDLRRFLFAGELALDGRVRPIKGVIALASLAKQRGARGVFVPWDNAQEAAVVEGIEVFGVRTLTELVGILNGEINVPPCPAPDVAGLLKAATVSVDFADVRGQEGVKRAMAIAAAGQHNILMLGPPGSGKTMMAKALPGILPALTPEQAIEITRIFSAAGQLPPGVGLMTQRPVRSPHHSASLPALIGGGMIPKPGDISLAHHGVLFLDELPEFDRDALESLRQPLEDHCVTIARSHGSVRFPAACMMVAAMNPTPKGDMPSGEVGRRAMTKYMDKISGPLLDRIDIHVEAPAVPWSELTKDRDAGKAVGKGPTERAGTSSAVMRGWVERARAFQVKRGQKLCNAHLGGKELDKVAAMGEQSKSLLGRAMTELGLSARGYDKIRRVARTIADIEECAQIEPQHVAEAVGYRLLDRKV